MFRKKREPKSARYAAHYMLTERVSFDQVAIRVSEHTNPTVGARENPCDKSVDEEHVEWISKR